MTGSEKRNAVFLLTTLMAAVVLLAFSLSGLELKPGMPLPEMQENQVVAAMPDSGPLEPLSINRFFATLFGILLVCSIIYTIYRLFRGANWHDILAVLRLIIIVAVMATVVILVVLLAPVSEGVPEVQVVLPTPMPPETAPLGPVPSVLLWVVGSALLVTGLAIAVWIYRSTIKRDTAIDMVAHQAEKARQDLLLGVGLKDVILKCYRAMSMALERERGIERDQSMTTLEFEEELTTAGVPAGPVSELTRLFNLARYGNWQPAVDDERRAIDCFEAISSFSRENRKVD